MHNQPTNICVVLPSPIGYSETFLQTHVDGLAAAVNYLENFPVDVGAVWSDQEADKTSEKLKRLVRMVWHRYLLNSIKHKNVKKFFNCHNVGVVLAEFGHTGVGVLSTCQNLEIPLIVHFHGFDAYSNSVLERNKDSYIKLFTYASAIVAVSRHMTEQLVRLGAPREKVVYNAYGVDTAKFQNHCYDASAMQILAVGRFVEKKAPYLTILAFKKVLEELPGAKLVMVGAGELFDPCRQLIRSLHIERSVDLRGVLSHGQVAELMRTSQVFVQHSLVPASGDSEGTPVAILEAAASALPVVSTKHTGIVDAVIHGKTGWLVDEGDIDGMADYLRLLLREPDLAVKMGKRGREHVCDNFDSQKSVDNLRRIIANVVSFRKSEPPAPNTERERHIVGVVQRL